MEGEWTWAALAAPKPVQYQHGRRDECYCPGADPSLLDLRWNTGVMPQPEYDAMVAEAKRAYALSGNVEQVVITYHGAGHKVNNEVAFQRLQRWIGMGDQE